MSSYSTEIVNRIIKDFEGGKFKIADICKRNGISKPTFYQWQKDKPNFLNLINKAKIKRLDAFNDMADSGLATLLQVFEYEEVKREYINKPYEKTLPDGTTKTAFKKELSKVTKIKKVYMPNPTMIIFAKTNLDKANYKHSSHVDHTTGGEKLEPSKQIDFKGLKEDTIEELMKERRKLVNN